MVDDEPDQIFTMKTMLESMSDEYELIGASNGCECLQLLKDGELPDLIFLDIMMPHISGWELFEIIRKNLNGRKYLLSF